MKRMNKSMMKLIFFTIIILISLMSGALLHAYAGGNPGADDAVVNEKSAARSETMQSQSAREAVIPKVTVDVCPGDTLWDIASAHLPKGENVRSYINKIKKANGMKSSSIQSGQILILP